MLEDFSSGIVRDSDTFIIDFTGVFLCDKNDSSLERKRSWCVSSRSPMDFARGCSLTGEQSRIDEHRFLSKRFFLQNNSYSNSFV